PPDPTLDSPAVGTLESLLPRPAGDLARHEQEEHRQRGAAAEAHRRSRQGDRDEVRVHGLDSTACLERRARFCPWSLGLGPGSVVGAVVWPRAAAGGSAPRWIRGKASRVDRGSESDQSRLITENTKWPTMRDRRSGTEEHGHRAKKKGPRTADKDDTLV